MEKGNFKQCLNCGTTDDSTFRYWCIDAKNFCYVLCRNCRKGSTAVPDVYYGYGSGIHSEENIADPKTGEPIPFWDKTSKREAMRRAGVMECGDRVHGARNDDMTQEKRKKYI
jgi:hypothetical protein